MKQKKWKPAQRRSGKRTPNEKGDNRTSNADLMYDRHSEITSRVHQEDYWNRTKAEECDRNKFLTLLEIVKETGKRLDKFLYKEFNKL